MHGRELDGALLDGFLFGWDVALEVHDIAEGRATLVTPLSELQGRLPANLVEHLRDREGRTMARERELAGRIVRLLERLGAG